VLVVKVGAQVQAELLVGVQVVLAELLVGEVVVEALVYQQGL